MAASDSETPAADGRSASTSQAAIIRAANEIAQREPEPWGLQESIGLGADRHTQSCPFGSESQSALDVDSDARLANTLAQPSIDTRRHGGLHVTTARTAPFPCIRHIVRGGKPRIPLTVAGRKGRDAAAKPDVHQSSPACQHKSPQHYARGPLHSGKCARLALDS